MDTNKTIMRADAMRRGVLFVAVFFVLPFLAFALPNDYNPAAVGAGKPEVHIKTDGTMTVRSAKVDQILSTTLFLTTRWGTMPLRWTMKTDTGTKVVKRYGGNARVADIKLGDYIDVEGDFFVGSDFFGLTAKSIKDWSLQEEAGTFSGKILEFNPNSFILQTPTQNITVQPATSTNIKKGGVAISWSRLRNGDTVVLADGVYDYAKNTLTATQIVVFQPTAAFAARNYEGVLKRIDAPRLPTVLTVVVGGAEYTVQMSEKTAVLKKGRALAELSRFVAGDTVRFYGPLRQEENILRDELVVDAEVVRNLNL
jgi:hypothetical protein